MVCNLFRVRSAASTSGGSDEDGGDGGTQESSDGSCCRCKCAGREASTAAICHPADRLAPTVDLVTRTGGRRGGDGIDGPRKSSSRLHRQVRNKCSTVLRALPMDNIPSTVS